MLPTDNILQLVRYTKFAPNSPTVMRGKLPRKDDRGHATQKTLLASLPSRKQAYVAAATAKVITLLVFT